MADPRSLHLQGIGTLSKVRWDWAEALSDDIDGRCAVAEISAGLPGVTTGNQCGLALMAMAIAVINSQVRQHGHMLRINGDGEVSVGRITGEGNIEMVAEYIESI